MQWWRRSACSLQGEQDSGPFLLYSNFYRNAVGTLGAIESSDRVSVPHTGLNILIREGLIAHKVSVEPLFSTIWQGFSVDVVALNV